MFFFSNCLKKSAGKIYCSSKIFNYMQHDKKISGYKINLILLNKIGKAKIFPSDLNKNIKPILAQQFN